MCYIGRIKYSSKCNSKCNSCNFAIVEVDLGWRALAWWRQSSFSSIFWAQLFAISSHKQCCVIFSIDFLSLFKTAAWISYQAYPKIQALWLSHLTFPALVSYRRLHSTRVIVSSTLKWSDESMIHLFSHIAWKNSFYFTWDATNSTLNRQHVVVFGQK